MGKILQDIIRQKRIVRKKKSDSYNNTEAKPKRRKRKKDLERLHQCVLEARKGSLVGIYRNGAKGKEVRKTARTFNQLPNKLYKARLQGEVSKLLNGCSSDKSEDDTATPLKDTKFSDRERIKEPKKLVKRRVLTEKSMESTSEESDEQSPHRDFGLCAINRYEELCARICNENFAGRNILPELPDPLQKIKNTLKNIQTEALRQHFLRPNSMISEHLVNSKVQTLIKNTVDERQNVRTPSVTSSQSCSPMGMPKTFESLTAGPVESSHADIGNSGKSLQSQASRYSLISEMANVKKECDTLRFPVLRLPFDMFDDEPTKKREDIVTNMQKRSMDRLREKCNEFLKGKCDIIGTKHGLRSKIEEKFLFNSCNDNSPQFVDKTECKNASRNMDDEKFNLFKEFEERTLPEIDLSQHCTRDFMDSNKWKCKLPKNALMNTKVDVNRKNKSKRGTELKATKSCKHVPTILRRSTCDSSSLSAFACYAERERQNTCSGMSPSHSSKKLMAKSPGVLRSILQDPCSSTFQTQNPLFKQGINLSDEEEKYAIDEKSLNKSQHERMSIRIPIEVASQRSIKDRINQKSILRPQKSVSFCADVSDMRISSQSHRLQNYPTTIVETDPLSYQVAPERQKLQEKYPSFVIKPSKYEEPREEGVILVNPSQTEACPNISGDVEERKPVYLQIVNQPLPPKYGQQIYNQAILQKPTATSVPYEQPIASQLFLRKPAENVQLVYREEPRMYTLNDVQNLRLLTLNESQNANPTHEQRRTTDCVFVQDVNQPRKYLALGDELNTQRVPIYFHNNDGGVCQQYLPHKFSTNVVESQNHSNTFIQEPASQVILVQGNPLHNRDQVYDRNYKRVV